MTAGRGVLVIGEPLAELRPRADGALDVGFSGDALNVAVRLARSGGEVALATAVGGDRFSVELLTRLASEGITDRWVHRDPDGVLGIYLVELDGVERRFTYWRSASAARHLVSGLGAATLAAAAAEAGVVVVSGITLAVLDGGQRRRLVNLLGDVAGAGTGVVVDPNVRPRLWGSPDEARRWTAELIGVATTVLASEEDLDLLGADAGILAGQVAELVVTAGAGPTQWWSAGGSGSVEVAPVEALDTTGAGDAFVAGYVSERMAAGGVADAVVAGHLAAADAVSHHGGLRWPAAPTQRVGSSEDRVNSPDSS